MQKIIDSFDSLSNGKAEQAAYGLAGLVGLAGARIADLNELCEAIATRECVPLPIVRNIVEFLSKRNACTSNLLEDLIPILPESMRPE